MPKKVIGGILIFIGGVLKWYGVAIWPYIFIVPGLALVLAGVVKKNN